MKSIPKATAQALVATVKQGAATKSLGLNQILQIFPDVPASIVADLGTRNTLTYSGGKFVNSGGPKAIEFTLDGAAFKIEIPPDLEASYIERPDGFRLTFSEKKRLKFWKLVKILFARKWVFTELLVLDVSPQEVFVDMDLNAADQHIPVA